MGQGRQYMQQYGRQAGCSPRRSTHANVPLGVVSNLVPHAVQLLDQGAVCRRRWGDSRQLDAGLLEGRAHEQQQASAGSRLCRQQNRPQLVLGASTNNLPSLLTQ